MPNRRDFILKTCGFCAAAAGLGFLATQLESCKTPEGAAGTEAIKPEVTRTQISIPVKAFDTKKNFLVKDISLQSDILVVKKPDGTYNALDMRCTHMGVALRATDTNLICDAHGSEFDFNGNVTVAPASRPLIKYPCTAEGDKVLVKLV